MADLEEKIFNAVEGYFAAFGKYDAGAVMALYAEDAVVEDPIGTPEKIGAKAIQTFYEKSMQSKAVLKRTGPIRINGNQAAFPFQAQVTMPAGRLEIDVIDVMTFNDDGKITSMRAYFGERNTKLVEG